MQNNPYTLPPTSALVIFPILTANPLPVYQASSNPVRLSTAIGVHTKLTKAIIIELISKQHLFTSTPFGNFLLVGRWWSYIWSLYLVLENPGKKKVLYPNMKIHNTHPQVSSPIDIPLSALFLIKLRSARVRRSENGFICNTLLQHLHARRSLLTMESQNWLYLEMSPPGHSGAGQEALNTTSAPTGSNLGFLVSGSLGSGKNMPHRNDFLQ